MPDWLGIVRSLFVYWRPGRQRGLRRFYRPLIAPGDLVFDVGAHLGDRSAAFASLGATVVALEPQPRVVGWLRRIVRRYRNVIVIPEAVGSRVGTATLAVSRRTPTVSTLAEGWRRALPSANPSFRQVRWEDSVEVEVTTLDELIRAYGVPRFCKIDVEGYESRVLAGLTQPVPALSVEFVSGGLDVVMDCVRQLEELGDYEFNVAIAERRSFALDHWIDSTDMERWLMEGAGEASSGDLYARLRTDGGRP